MSKENFVRYKHILLRTNLIICLILIVGFSLTAVISYRTSFDVSLDNIEHVSTLTAEGIYYQMAGTFTKPVNISLTMAKDPFLGDFLNEEKDRLDDPSFTESVRNYLAGYKDLYGYESVFLVSDASKRYYNFNGLDRMLDDPDNRENEWYYKFRTTQKDYNLVIDNDEVSGAKNAITVFVNCRIEDENNNYLGAVGVGLIVGHFQSLMKGYETKFGVKASLLDGEGFVELSSDRIGYGEKVDWFLDGKYSDDVRKQILDWKKSEGLNFWVGKKEGVKDDFIVARYMSELNWYLIVEQNTDKSIGQLNAELVRNILFIVAIILLILLVVTYVIRNFNRRIVALTRSTENERKSAFEQVTGHLFENIYELDITHNKAGNAATVKYFESLGVPENTSFDKALVIVAEKQIKEEFRDGYVSTFNPDNVCRAFENGQDLLSYEFMILDDSGEYYWMRIVAQIVRLESDDSIHMYTYRQNIDAEKLQEQRMRLLAQTDEMTGFLNKTETEKRVNRLIDENPGRKFAFFIFDIDNFKSANDKFGHAFGDAVIMDFTGLIRNSYTKNDVLGRIGGDEFAVFCPYDNKAELRAKAETLSAGLCHFYEKDGNKWSMSASIGIAFFPHDGFDFDMLYKNADAALYETKARGKNGFSFFGE